MALLQNHFHAFLVLGRRGGKINITAQPFGDGRFPGGIFAIGMEFGKGTDFLPVHLIHIIFFLIAIRKFLSLIADFVAKNRVTFAHLQFLTMRLTARTGQHKGQTGKA